MSMDFVTAGLLVALLILVLWWLTRRPSGFPPGPPLLPIAGNFFSMDKDPRVTFRKLRRQYGDIFSVYLFNQPIIVLNGFSVLKEALVKNGDVFSNRPHSFVTDQVGKNKGVITTSGPTWKEHRRFALTTLRDLGMGKSLLEEKIKEEVSVFLQAFDDEKGQPFDFNTVLHNAVSNIICSVVFGNRFEYTDPIFRKFLDLLQENFRLTQFSNILDMIPILKYLPGDLFKFKRVLTNVDSIENELISPNIEKHMQRQDNDLTDDFISAYIKEMKKRGEESSMNKEELNSVCLDLFAAGTETTATTIRWAVAFFLNYPDVQERCFKELKENIGLNKPPSMKDKTSLPYLEATIMELQRKSDIVPTSVPHSMSQDVHFHGYTFPKGVTVYPMLSSVLEDPDVWGDPENFRPQRFLDDTGKVRKMEGLIPFSVGRRLCLGESLAKMELFLFLASMIQRFKFVSVNGEKPSLEGVVGITNYPKPFKVRAVPRN